MSTPSLAELLAQRQALESQIQLLQTTQRAEAIAKIRALMSEYGLTVADLGGHGYRPASSVPRARSSGTGTPAPIKYRDAATGQTWSGRGLQPNWLKAAIASGKKLTDFSVDAAATAATNAAQASIPTPKPTVSNAAADVTAKVDQKPVETKKEEAKPAAAANNKSAASPAPALATAAKK